MIQFTGLIAGHNKANGLGITSSAAKKFVTRAAGPTGWCIFHLDKQAWQVRPIAVELQRGPLVLEVTAHQTTGNQAPAICDDKECKLERQ